MFFQNLSKPLLYKIFVKKKYVMLVGKNENAEIISKLLEEKQTYHMNGLFQKSIKNLRE